LARGILRRRGDEVRRRLFEASKERLGGVFLIIIIIIGEDFGRSLWRF